jgi:UDP-N-acetylglucosamine 1-carboxyvinyltransferase
LRAATISEPGGCSIGDRPIDIHLKGLAELGAVSHTEGGNVYIPKANLVGKEIFLGGKFGSTVLGTDNVMMAATRAKGLTIIESAACEPEVRDLAEFLKKMGAKIVGRGTRRIEIEGVDRLGGVEHTVIPDRIEAGTYMVAALITQGDVFLAGADADHLVNVIDRMKSCGAHIKAAPMEFRSRPRANSVPLIS